MHISPATRKRLDRLGDLETISLLVLLFIAMPLKYIWDQPLAVRWVGMIHGILFIAFVAALVHAQFESRWPVRYTLLGIVASFVPFGPRWAVKRISQA